MSSYEYDRRLKRPERQKLPDFERNGRLKHVLFAAQFDKRLLRQLTQTATMIRLLQRSRETARELATLLSHRRAMLYFTQASTRTFLSFSATSDILGMTTEEIRDPSVSSEYKGESPFDSMRMFSSYFDMVVVRSRVPDFAECCAYLMNDLDSFNERSVPIISGGAGADEHPTQALLDFYTIERAFAFESDRDSDHWTRFSDLRKRHPGLTQGIEGKTYTFCGDIGRGRTVRSLALLLAQYDNVAMNFVAPDHPQLRLGPDLRDRLLTSGVDVREADSLSEVIEATDLLYMTRVQNEHNREGDDSVDRLSRGATHLTVDLVDRMKEYAQIMHPFPRNDEIPTEIDHNPRALYFEQARNGMWIRASLIAYLFDVDSEVRAIFDSAYSARHDYNEGAL